MNELHAFVGHSFVEDDAALVGTFLKYFDQLAVALPHFSWTHAEGAEPRELASKVQSLLEGKNVFIGICTKKERVVADNCLSELIFRPNYLKAANSDFEWKTSDWIIQEIGLAIGRKLDLILLVETGLRKPGGLQGNVEYIEFDRGFPQRAFGKITEMLSALTPRARETLTEFSDKKSEPASEKREPTSIDIDEWTTPRTDWERHNYEVAFFHKTISKDAEGATAIDSAYRGTTHASEDDNWKTWQAYCELTKLEYGEGGSLTKLEELARSQSRNSEIQDYLAQGYEHFQDHMKAADAFEAAANVARDDDEAIRLHGHAANALARVGDVAAENALVETIKTKVQITGKGEAQLLRALRALAEFRKESYAELGIMERLVQLNPADIDTRFSLAYKYSECGEEDLAMFHYLRIPSRQRNSNTWNNLGVAFDKLQMPAKSVGAYRAAERDGETLAMSNLARKFMAAGFTTEAKELCDKALATEDFHKNIPRTLARLQTISDEESAKETEVLRKVEPKFAFFKDFGRALMETTPTDIGSVWQGPNGALAVSLVGPKFEAAGEYDQSQLNYLAVSLTSSSNSALPPIRYQVKYCGTIRGHTIECSVVRTKKGAAQTSLLASSNDEIRTLMILSEDANDIKAMELSQEGSPQFYSLKRTGSAFT